MVRSRLEEYMAEKLSDADLLTQAVERYRDGLYRSGAVLVATDGEQLFGLRSGGESWVYVDHGELMTKPEHFRPFVTALALQIRQLFDPEKVVLLNVLSKCSPQMTGAVAYSGEFRQIGVLSDAVAEAEKGTRRGLRVPKDIGVGDTLVFLDDVLTTGKTVVETMTRVRNGLVERLGEVAGEMQVHLLVGLARNPEKATNDLLGYGIQPHWLTTLDEVIRQCWPALTSVQQNGLKREFGNLET